MIIFRWPICHSKNCYITKKYKSIEKMIPETFFLTMLFNLITCYTPKNDSDVIFTFGGHAEAISENKQIIKEKPKKQITTKTNVNTPVLAVTVVPNFGAVTESVIFVPNAREPDTYRKFEDNDDYLTDNGPMISDIINGVGKNIQVATETPNMDIVFLRGKNHENEGITSKTKDNKKERNGDSRRSGIGKETDRKVPELDCNNLNCNNTVKSLCGGKMEHKKWRYRLFLNECYFRKVNCAFNYEFNRFEVVPIEKCNNVGAHYPEKPFVIKPSLEFSKEEKITKTRRSFIERRSRNKDMFGLHCSHFCPTTCPEDYDPQCAMAGTGQLKVFLNHCKLDYSSCLSGHAWQLRPLSVCVGGKKADMRQNRAFIGWMQRVGIVDNKGRLVLS